MEPILIKKEKLISKIIKREKKILIISICSILTLLLSTSYALLTNFSKSDEILTFKTGNLEISILNGEKTFSLINLNNKLPENDQSGLTKSTTIPITLKNTGSILIGEYKIRLLSETGTENISTLNEEYIRFSVSLDNITYSNPSTLTENDNIIFTDYDLEIDSTKTIYLKVWIDENAKEEGLDKLYYGSLSIDLKQDYKIAIPEITNYSSNGDGTITFNINYNNSNLFYCINKNQEDTIDCNWNDAVIGEQITEAYVTESGTYYVHVKDSNDVVGHSEGIEINLTYNVLDYIENSATQYIDTGYIPNYNTSVDIIYQAINYSSSQYIMGARKTSSSTILYSLSGSSSKTIWHINMDGSATFSTLERTADKYRSQVTSENGTGTWILENLDTNETDNISFSNMTVSSTVNLFLFSLNSSNIHKNLRVYNCKIYDNKILVRDFIPVERITDGVIGLYDKVNNKLYENSGTGTFTKGEQIGVME